jgi:hypothetical protein
MILLAWNLVRSWPSLSDGGWLVACGLLSRFAGGKRVIKRLHSSATGGAAAYA